MQEDTESFNENSSSEVIILPQNTHLETLISDDEETDAESRASYETKLNAKLKDLGLYEDGMTIQQKEELLTVVAVSFKTAEEEKTRRQWYEEYANAALNFPEDEIEFSFQQSPEPDLSEKITSYSTDYHPNGIKTKGNSSSEFDRKSGHNASATVTRESLALNDCHNLPSTSSQGIGFKSKPQARRNRIRGEGNSSFKLSLEEGNTVTSHSAETVLGYKDAILTSNRQKRKLLEKSMSRWKPCLSPKDEPLIRINHQVDDDSVESCTQPSIQTRMCNYMQEFNFAIAEIKKASQTPSHFGKPYHLTRSGHCLRKTTKVDSLDIMVGVQEGRNEVASTSDSSISLNPATKKEPFSRTSGGAFRYAQLHRDRIDALRNSSAIMNNQNPMTNHTITRYSGPNSVDDYRTSPEILIEDEMLSDRFDSSALHQGDSSEQAHCDGDIKISSDIKLPKFSNLKPHLCQDDFSEKEILSRHLTLPHTSTSCSTVSCSEGSAKAALSVYKKENHVESSCHDGDLSDCSSVIDVETIVDDEIEEFVLKRKLLQESTSTDKQTYSNRYKRLKKNTS
ncbi:uncharacterized protein [Parasteatoda tepidariorum]|uniref:uncharacterized protein isoform X2 n=1 Tax=Parasteatoda tepidariorum TaxID=114398 RepID=UPI001C729135|nr:uncharacterized protein LOC107437358 isoform X2 [Parasteatoda tepidariorum]